MKKMNVSDSTVVCFGNTLRAFKATLSTSNKSQFNNEINKQ